VNNDPAAGIDPHQNAGVSDITGGSLAGGPRVPWATFEQQAGGAQLIFVRAFKNNAWVTQGPPLNIDRSVQAEGPATGDPTLNVDPSRNGIEPDDAFTGPGDTVA
jgi:hypothetical protein